MKEWEDGGIIVSLPKMEWKENYSNYQHSYQPSYQHFVKVMLIAIKTIIRLINSAAPPYFPTILHPNHQYSKLHEKGIPAPPFTLQTLDFKTQR